LESAGVKGIETAPFRAAQRKMQKQFGVRVRRVREGKTE